MVLALVQVLKKAGLPSRFAPVASIVLGLGAVFAVDHQSIAWIPGIIVGLSASGLWSGSKSIVAPSAE